VKLPLVFVFALAATPALAVDSTGIDSCDAFLKRYETCATQLPTKKQIHDAQMEMLQGALTIRGAAADPAMKADLDKFCKDRFETMKKAGDIKECMASAETGAPKAK